MAGTTDNYGYPFPESDDSPAGHTQIEALAEALSLKGVQVFTDSGSISKDGGQVSTFSGASGKTLILPAAEVGDVREILNIDSSDSVTVARAGSDTINGGTTVSVPSGFKLVCVCVDAATWVAYFSSITGKVPAGVITNAMLEGDITFAKMNAAFRGQAIPIASVSGWASSFSGTTRKLLGAHGQAVDVTDLRDALLFDFKAADYSLGTLRVRLVGRMIASSTDPLTSADQVTLGVAQITAGGGATPVIAGTLGSNQASCTWDEADIGASGVSSREENAVTVGGGTMDDGVYGFTIAASAGTIDAAVFVTAQLQAYHT